MIGTLLGFLAAFFLLFYPGIEDKSINWNTFTPFLISFSLLFLLLEGLSLLLFLNPLEKAANTNSLHLFGLIKKNKSLIFFSLFLFFFALFSLFVGGFIPFQKNYTLAIWFVLFGAAFDCLKNILVLGQNYLDPFSAIKQFKLQGIKEIQNQKEIELCNTLDAIAESCIKAIKAESPSLANNAIDALLDLSRHFLESSKSISHQNQDKEMNNLGIQDKVTYILAYLFQKIDFIFKKALKNDLEPVLNFTTTSVGKIAFYAAKCDMTLPVQPLIHFGKFAITAVQHKFLDVGVRSICALLEIAKAIVAEVDLKYVEIQEPFLCLIGQLENISKEIFKEDKKIKMMLLTQPFLDLKELFEQETLASHQDTPIIQKDLDRILAEYQILETVMRTMPPMPDVIHSK